MNISCGIFVTRKMPRVLATRSPGEEVVTTSHLVFLFPDGIYNERPAKTPSSSICCLFFSLPPIFSLPAFEYVSSPQYAAELVAWAGFAILTWGPGGLIVLTISMANLIPRAFASHAWYPPPSPHPTPALPLMVCIFDFSTVGFYSF